MKRQRGRGRKPGGGGGNYHNNQGGGGGHYNPHRSLDSNGPEAKVRGTASHINERYLQLARDASSSGDRVLSENYLQHADHYFRLWRSTQPAAPVQQQQNFNDNADYEGDDDGVQDGEGGEENETRGEGDDRSGDDYQGERQREGSDRGEGDRGPRRGRNRRRFSPDGERQGGQEAREGDNREQRNEGGEPREQREAREPREQREPREPRDFREPRRERTEGGEPRREPAPEGAEPRRERTEAAEPRPPRRERQPREDRDAGSREGFSDGPKPAFLRGSGGGGGATE